MDFPEFRKESLRLRRKRRIHLPLIREAFYQCLYSSLPLEETPLLGEMSQTEGSAVSGEEKLDFAEGERLMMCAFLNVMVN